jgi:integrase
MMIVRLPQNVTRFKDRHDKWRYRWRKKGRTVYIHAKPGTPEFYREVAEAETVGQGPPPGTFDDLILRYYQSPRWTQLAETTQYTYRRLLEQWRDNHGHRMVADTRTSDIDRNIEPMAPTMANRMRKLLVSLFDYAIKLEWMERNPAVHADKQKVRVKGFHTWTEAEIEQFEAFYPIGTQARLAFALMLYTGQRRSDVVRMTHEDVQENKIRVVQQKTGKKLVIPIHPALQTVLDASELGTHTLLETTRGPFQANVMGNYMRRWCNAAGLPECSSHGLRKAMARRLAEKGASNQGLKSIGGWSGDREVGVYTRAVDQELMAEKMLQLLLDS